jgi:protein TonB
MFDSILRSDTLPKRRFGWGAVISAIVFAGGGAFIAWSQARAAHVERKEVAVTFVKPPPPPPPRPSPAAQPRLKPKKVEPPKTVQLAQAIVAPTVVPREKPPEQEPPQQPPGPPGGELGGEVPGVAGGINGVAVVGAAAPKGPVDFDPGKMDPPKLLGGPEIRYTDKALEREVQGKMIVKCIVTTDGKVTSCRVVQGLAFMDWAVIGALEKRRYVPATLGGKPVEVDYTFVLNLKLPE